MAQVVILSDVTSTDHEFGFSRSIGPHVLAEKARKAGFTCSVIDYFTRLTSLKEILASVIGPETIFFGISGTFLSVSAPSEIIAATHSNNYSGYLWFKEIDELQQFVSEVKTMIKNVGSNAPVVLGGSKALFFAQDP